MPDRVECKFSRARNDALTSQLRSAIHKATLALKAGKHDEAATACLPVPQ
jgi:ribosomal protein S20